MTKPTDPAGEKFDEALETAKRLAITRFHENHDDGDSAIYAMLPAIRTAADTMAAERVREAQAKTAEGDLAFLTEMREYLTSKVGDGIGQEYVLVMINDWIAELAALEAKEEK